MTHPSCGRERGKANRSQDHAASEDQHGELDGRVVDLPTGSEETANDQLKTHLRGPGRILRLAITGAGPPGDLGLAAGPPRHQRPDHPSRRGRRHRPRPDLVHPHPAHHPAAPPPVRRLFPPQDWDHALPHVIAEITCKINPERRDRSYPRVVKRARHNNDRVKKPGETGTRHPGPATIKIRTINPRAA